MTKGHNKGQSLTMLYSHQQLTTLLALVNILTTRLFFSCANTTWWERLVNIYMYRGTFKMMKLYHFLISISWFEEIIPDTLRANIPCSLLFFVIIASFLIIIKIFQCTKPGIITWLMHAYTSTFVRELQQIYRILNEFACIIPLRELLGQ